MQSAISIKGRRYWLSRLFLKVLLFMGIIAVMGAAGFMWYWNTHKRSIVKDTLQKTVEKNSNGLYHLGIGKLDFDETAGWLTLSSVQLNYDSLRYKVLQTEEDTPPILVNMNVRQLNIDGVKSAKDVKKGKLKGHVMEIVDPVIDIVYTYHGKNAARNIPTREEIFHDLINGMDIQLDSVLIRHAEIRTRNYATGKPIVSVTDLSISLYDLQMNEPGLKDSSRLFFSKDFVMKGGTVKWTSLNKLYHYNVNGLSVISSKKEILVGGFSVQPQLSEAAFVQSMPVQTDRCEFRFGNIRATGVDFSSLLDEDLYADELILGSASFKAYRDLNKPEDLTSKIGKFPQQVMFHTPFRFDIRKVILQSSNIDYKQKSNITHEMGRVIFNNLNVVAHNFTNDPAAVKRNNVMLVDATASFLGKSLFKTHWTFYLNHPSGHFLVKGTAGPMDGPQLNPLMEPMGPARIDRGYLDGLSFDMSGNDMGMTGTVQLLYNDLKLTLLELDKGAVKTDKKFLTSLFANILIKNDNPKKKEAPRVAQVAYTREINSSLFNMCWKALFQGLRASVGINR